jgi:hypothetical protein
MGSTLGLLVERIYITKKRDLSPASELVCALQRFNVPSVKGVRTDQKHFKTQNPKTELPTILA